MKVKDMRMIVCLETRVVTKLMRRTTCGGTRTYTSAGAEGYNVSLLAYGQTGSGKSHTMFGRKSCRGSCRGSARRCSRRVKRVYL